MLALSFGLGYLQNDRMCLKITKHLYHTIYALSTQNVKNNRKHRCIGFICVQADYARFVTDKSYFLQKSIKKGKLVLFVIICTIDLYINK